MLSSERIYQKAFEIFGYQKQMIVAVEELSELQKEVCKFLRDGGNRTNLIEELADATIMLEQIMYLHQIYDFEVENVIAAKLERLLKRINEARGAG